MPVHKASDITKMVESPVTKNVRSRTPLSGAPGGAAKMKRIFLSTVAVLVVFACKEIVAEPAGTRVGPAIQRSESGAGAEAVVPEARVSTTCQSFRKELDAGRERLTAETHTNEFERKQAALRAIVADVCH
jgi:hypothetical protein